MAEIDLDVLASNFVRKDLLAEEPDLYVSKWYDYRHLHYVTCSGQFVSEYSRAFRQASQLRIDFEEGKSRTGLKWGKSLFDLDKATITGVWKARQHCDRKGMPYGVFCGIAMEIATKCGWEFLPRPQHLCGDDLIERIEYHWQDLLLHSPPLSQEDRFLACAFKGEQDQIAYRDYLVGLVKARHHPQYMLATMLAKGRLDCEFAASAFDSEVLDLALEIAPTISSYIQ